MVLGECRRMISPKSHPFFKPLIFSLFITKVGLCTLSIWKSLVILEMDSPPGVGPPICPTFAQILSSHKPKKDNFGSRKLPGLLNETIRLA